MRKVKKMWRRLQQGSWKSLSDWFTAGANEVQYNQMNSLGNCVSIYKMDLACKLYSDLRCAVCQIRRFARLF